MNPFLIEGNRLIRCNDLKGTVVVPEGIVEIDDFAFYGCERIKEIILPEGLRSIGNSAFYGCRSLETVYFPDSVEYIGSALFANCSSLLEAYLPKGMSRVPRSTFYNCSNIYDVYLEEGIKVIEHDAFSGCVNLREIHFPSTLIEVGEKAFLGCRELFLVNMNEGLKRIGEKAFYRTVSLNELKLPQSVEEIGFAAFETWWDIKFESNETLFLTPMMFDSDYNYDAGSKNVGKCLFKEAYLPKLDIEEWKPFARLLILMSFFETYDKHSEESRTYYLKKAHQYKEQLLNDLISKVRYKALNQALELKVFTPKDIEPYFERIYDREEIAKILSYQAESSILDDLEKELEDLF